MTGGAQLSSKSIIFCLCMRDFIADRFARMRNEGIKISASNLAPLQPFACSFSPLLLKGEREIDSLSEPFAFVMYMH
jgi:hypothetical protein